jgi:hypothetical protein
VPGFLGSSWRAWRKWGIVPALWACGACGFPDYTADLDDGFSPDGDEDVTVDAPADVSPDATHDAVTDGTDGGGETHADASDAFADCDPETGGVDATSCASCAVSKCNSQLTNCEAAATCKAFIDCTGTCRCETAIACFEGCRSAHPSTEGDALTSCLASNCIAECSG